MRTLPLALMLLLTPTLALAHAAHDTGTVLSGAAHPIGGLDHILAMLAVGLLAAQQGGRAQWAMPLAFVGAMLLGGALGFAGLGFPAVEPMILASIVILGVLVALAVRLPLTVTLPVLALFGAAHGWAHGAEGPASGMVAYAAGFALMTAALHGAGLILGRGVGTLPLRAAGGAAAVAGLVLALG
jgi:urease accessory protein